MVSISCFRSGVPGQSKPEASSKAKTELPCEELRFGKEEGDNGYEAFAAPAEAACRRLLPTWHVCINLIQWIIICSGEAFLCSFEEPWMTPCFYA